MDEKRAKTGVPGMDEDLQGGFPQGSMILIAGSPGTGKTMLSGQFLHHGAAACAESGLYVSFSEGRSAFLDNMMKLNLDFKELEKGGRFEVLDLITVKEPGIDTLMEMVTSRIDALGAERLVIDSFTAMANAFSTVIDARVTLHLLSKIVRQTGCTTLLVTEIPTGLETIGMGVEEFVVDGIIILRRLLLDGYTIRKLEVAKMRGTRIEEPRRIFTLHEGFKVFTPFRREALDNPSRFSPIPNGPERYSTGHVQLDEILGGLRRGDTVFVEVGDDVPAYVPTLMFGPLRANFMTGGMGVFFLPPGGESVENVLRCGKRHGVTEDEHRRLLRVVAEGTEEEAPYILAYDNGDPGEILSLWGREKQRLMEETKAPVLNIAYLDKIVTSAPPESLRRALETAATATKSDGGLLLLLCKAGTEDLKRSALNVANIHLRLHNEQGVILFNGLQPRTPLYALETTTQDGCPGFCLTPIV